MFSFLENGSRQNLISQIDTQFGLFVWKIHIYIEDLVCTIYISKYTWKNVVTKRNMSDEFNQLAA